MMCLTLRMMSSGAWSSGETLNTQHQSGEAEVTILMIYLLRWSFKVEEIVGCTHLLVDVEYAQLEVELNTLGMVRLWSTLGVML